MEQDAPLVAYVAKARCPYCLTDGRLVIANQLSKNGLFGVDCAECQQSGFAHYRGQHGVVIELSIKKYSYQTMLIEDDDYELLAKKAGIC